MNSEMNSMKNNGVKYILKLHNGENVSGCKWCLETKKDLLGNINI